MIVTANSLVLVGETSKETANSSDFSCTLTIHFEDCKYFKYILN